LGRRHQLTHPIDHRNRRRLPRSSRCQRLHKDVGRAAHEASDKGELLATAQRLNSEFGEPLTDSEVLSIVDSVWGYQTSGTNRFGKHGAWFTAAQVTELVHDPYLFSLVGFLKAKYGPTSTFWVANGLHKKLGWPRRQLVGARNRAIDAGWIKAVHNPWKNQPALYCWNKRS
jgi:hypothetical protein